MTIDEAAWEEVLIAYADVRDLEVFIQKYSAVLIKRPRNKIVRDLLAYALSKQGSSQALFSELLETYSIWPDRPLVLTRIADVLMRSGESHAASELYSLAAAGIRCHR